MIVTDLNKHNIQAVAQLEKVCFGIDGWSENLLCEEIGKANKHYDVLMKNDEVLAYGGFAQVIDEGHIMNIAVSPLHRNKGLATYIINSFVKKAKALGINAFTLEVRESNYAARNLYEKAKFTLAGTRKGFYQDKENGCIYWRYLEEELL